MRLKERIPIILKLIDWNKYLDTIPDLEDKFKEELLEFLNNEDEIKELELFWNANPDLRLSQVLINYGVLPNMPGFWYYKEYHDILQAQGIDPREFMFWGRHMNKDGTMLPKPEYILIKDLEDDHLKALVEGKWGNDIYQHYFKTELNYRNERKHTGES